MLDFGVVKRIGEGKYLDEDSFIIERVRKERALNARGVKVNNPGCKTQVITKDEEHDPS